MRKMVLCNDMTGHVFVWAGDPLCIPDGWPCTCGKTEHGNDNENAEIQQATVNDFLHFEEDD